MSRGIVGLSQSALDRDGHLACGCEPGHRCEKHARMKKDNKPDRYSESVVQRVFVSNTRTPIDGWIARHVRRRVEK